MRNLAAVYERHISPIIEHTASMIPMYSTVSSKKITDPTELEASYWARGLSSPVQFGQAVANVMSDFKESQLILLEVGAHSTFSTFIKHILEGSSNAADKGPARIYIPTLTRNDPDARAQLLSVIGRLHCLGLSLDLTKVTGVQRILCNLPRYPWDRQLYRRESRLAREWRLRAAPHHELLGSRVVTMPEAEPAWRNLLQLGDVLWLSDHVLSGKVVFPVAGYIAMAGAACLQLSSDSASYSVRNLSLNLVLTLLPGQRLEILTTLKRQRYNDLTESEWYAFSISCHDGTGWTQHCGGQVRADHRDGALEYSELHDIPAPYSRRVNAEQWYASMRKHGYEYGQCFRRLENVSADPVQIAAIGTIPETPDNEPAATYVLHPTVIDRCLQMMGIAHSHGLSRRVSAMEVPKSIEFVSVARASQKTTVSVHGVDDGGQSTSWNAAAISDGKPVLYMRNLCSIALNMKLKQQMMVPPLTTLRWTPLVDVLPPAESLLSKASRFTADGKQLPWSKFLSQLGHSLPSLRALQIGVDAPDMTKSNLELLRTSEGTPLFSSYTVTSALTASLDPAKLLFDGIAGVNFKTFAVGGDLESQGFEPHSFDLVVTSNPSHLVSLDILASIRRLLTDSGWLLGQNADFMFPAHYSLGEATTTDIMEHCKFLLQQGGLQCGEVLIDDNKDRGARTLSLLTKVAPNEPRRTKNITLLRGSHVNPQVDAIERHLVQRGYTVTQCTLGTVPPPGQHIISLIDFDYTGLHRLSELVYQQLKDFLLNSTSHHILWLTGEAQLDCLDPRYGLGHGLIRTLRRECGLDLSILEISEIDDASAELIVDLQRWTERVPGSRDRKRDSEFAILDGKVHVGRYHWVSALPRQKVSSASATRVARLQLRPNPSDKICHWAPSELDELREDEIQVELRFVGLNFRVRFQI